MALANGTYKVRNYATGDYLRVGTAGKAGKWQLTASEDEATVVVVSGTTVKAVNGAQKARELGASNGYAVNNSASAWTIAASGDGYTVATSGSYLCVVNGVLRVASSGYDTGANVWVFDKDLYTSNSIQVAASIGVGVLSTIDTDNKGFGNTTVDLTVYAGLYPSWIGSGTEWQGRFRYRRRPVSSDSMSDWSEWQSIAETPESGWGDAWSAGVSVSESVGGRLVCADAPYVANPEEYDYHEVQYAVRKWSSDLPYSDGLPYSGEVGSIANQTIIVRRRPIITVSGVSISAYGLVVSYSSTFERMNNTVTISSVKSGSHKVCDSVTFSAVGHSGTVTIPFESVRYMPGTGSSISLCATIATCDGSVSKQASYSGEVTGSTADMTLTATEKDGKQYVITGPYDLVSCRAIWTRGGQTEVVECESTEDGWVFTPPLGTDCTVYATAYSGGSVYIGSVPISAITATGHMFNFDEGFFNAVAFSEVTNTAQMSASSASQTFDVNEGYQAVSFGGGKSATLTLDCAAKFADQTDGTGLQDARALEAAHFAWYRSPLGDLRRVAITAMGEQPLAGGWVSLSVSMTEVG